MPTFGVEKCVGPGVCIGHAAPGDAAAHSADHNRQTSGDRQRSREKEDKSCPGGALCPGAGVCPHCQDANVHMIKAPKRLSKDNDEAADHRDNRIHAETSTDILSKEMKSMVLLPNNLDELRAELKAEGRIIETFEENDMLERMTTLWEAVTTLKNNDEAMAVRLIKHDAAIKKIPQGVLEKLQKSDFGENNNSPPINMIGTTKPVIGPTSATPSTKRIDVPTDGLTKDDIQLIFANLNNLLLESATSKQKLDNLMESVRIMDNNIVTKQMMVDALNDKADKGQMNTKVSYDEYGNSMDELTTRIQNLLVEVYQKNETWKHITDHLGEELSDKLDKTELAPVKSYFKTHLKALEERVRYLTEQLEEPDPAGTRRKLLKDMNCLSCNRHASISGVTNAPILPLIGPILAGHQTSSKRAFDLHNMRVQKSRFDPNSINLNIMETQVRAVGKQQRGSGKSMNDQNANAMPLVNRYVGGSHTAVSNAERISSFNRSKISNAGGEMNGFPPVIELEEEENEEQSFYEEVNEQFPFLDNMEE